MDVDKTNRAHKVTITDNVTVTSRARGKSYDEWYESYDELLRLARDLLASGYLQEHNVSMDYNEADALLDYFRSPHYWNRVHAWWESRDWPDDYKSWEEGHATGFKVAA